MYSKASKSIARIKRIASDSTKPHPFGRIDMIPPWAREPYEYYNDVRQRYEQIKQQWLAIDEQLRGVRSLLKQTLPHRQFLEATAENQRLSELHQELQRRIAHLKPDVRTAWSDANDALKYYLATQYLDPSTISEIEKLVRKFMHATTLNPPHRPNADYSEMEKLGRKRRTRRRLVRLHLEEDKALRERLRAKEDMANRPAEGR